MNKYSIILPDEKAGTYRQVTIFILLINFFVFAFIYLNSVDVHIRRLGFYGIVISFFSLVIFLLLKYRKRETYRIEISFIILSALWFFLERYLLGLSILCFAVIGFYTKRKLEIIFLKDHIIYPSLPKKKISWSDVANVILKDGMLTIDLKSNKLIQVVIDKDPALQINEREFNLFCKECLGEELKMNN